MTSNLSSQYLTETVFTKSYKVAPVTKFKALKSIDSNGTAERTWWKRLGDTDLKIKTKCLLPQLRPDCKIIIYEQNRAFNRQQHLTENPTDLAIVVKGLLKSAYRNVNYY